MTLFPLLAATLPAATAATPDVSLSPVKLFLEADIVVQAVMVGLILASIWTWAIIVSQWVKARTAFRASERFEREFW